jgi:hypothetical protein
MWEFGRFYVFYGFHLWPGVFITYSFNASITHTCPPSNPIYEYIFMLDSFYVYSQYSMIKVHPTT